jgi:preprotein translocase subunit SecA
MAQKDPLVEYRGEGHAMFEELGRSIREEVVLTLFHVELAPQDVEQLQPAEQQGALQYEHETSSGAEAIAAAGGGSATAVATPPRPQQVVKEHPDIGRNDPCWCGSGKKYKKCHGA